MAVGDPDLLVFSDLSEAVHEEYPDPVSTPDPWARSPFRWFANESSPRKGAIGKKLVRQWAEHEGMHVGKSGHGSDFRIDGLRIAVKTGLVWAGQVFVFEQIREQGYEAAALLGLEPERARLWVVPREVLWDQADWQHGHANKWLHVPPEEPPSWLSAYGGTLPQARQALEQARDELSG